MERAILLGNYLENLGSWGWHNQGRTFDPEGLAPTLCGGMGGGGNQVPAILIRDEGTDDNIFRQLPHAHKPVEGTDQGKNLRP